MAALSIVTRRESWQISTASIRRVHFENLYNGLLRSLDLTETA